MDELHGATDEIAERQGKHQTVERREASERTEVEQSRGRNPERRITPVGARLLRRRLRGRPLLTFQDPANTTHCSQNQRDESKIERMLAIGHPELVSRLKMFTRDGVASARTWRHDSMLSQASLIRLVARLLIDTGVIGPAVDLCKRELERVLRRKRPARAEQPALRASLFLCSWIIGGLGINGGGTAGNLFLTPRNIMENCAPKLRQTYQQGNDGNNSTPHEKTPPPERLPLADQAPDTICKCQRRKHQPKVRLTRTGPGEHGAQERPVVPLALPDTPIDQAKCERTVHEPDEPAQVPRREKRKTVAHQSEGSSTTEAGDVGESSSAQIEGDPQRGQPGGEGKLQFDPDVHPANHVHEIGGNEVLSAKHLPEPRRRVVDGEGCRAVRRHRDLVKRPGSPEDCQQGERIDAREHEKRANHRPLQELLHHRLQVVLYTGFGLPR